MSLLSAMAASQSGSRLLPTAACTASAESVAGVAAAPSLASTVPCSVVDGVGVGVVNGE